jgi:hypothetical protein
MRLMLTELGFGNTVVLNKRTVCGAYVRAASAFHAYHYFTFFKYCYALILDGIFKRFGKGNG